MHFFRRSKIYLDAFTCRQEVIEYAPVVNASKVIPDWWKQLPKDTNSGLFFPHTTMKTCVGMQDYYNKSIVLPLWCDLQIKCEGNGTYHWQFSDNISGAESHTPKQFHGFVDDTEYGQLKLLSPWFFKTKADIDWLVTDPAYNRQEHKNYFLAQGLLNFKHQIATNLQLFLDVSNTKNYLIPFGSTFLFTPLTDKKVIVRRHLVTELEYARAINKSAAFITFINNYKKRKSIPVCPYKDETK